MRKAEVVGYSPDAVVKTIKEKAPPTQMVPESEWSAWAGEAGMHEGLHTRPSKNYTETMNVVWEYGVITTTLAIEMPKIINQTYMTMEWLYFEVATAAFVRPMGGFEQLTAKVIKESAEAVGKRNMSQPDWNIWQQADNQLKNQAQTEPSQESVGEKEARNNNQPQEPDNQKGKQETNLQSLPLAV